MFCSECGRENRDEARYCKKCGAEIDSDIEQETVVAQRKPQAETPKLGEEPVVFSIRPTLMFVKMGYIIAVISAFILAALLATVGPIVNLVVSSAIVVLLGISLLLIPAYYHLRQKTIRYTLTDSKVAIDEGLLSKSTRNVPLRIIQDVTVSANLFQRLLGFGDIEIENANESDSKIVLRNINSPNEYAAKMLDQMRRLNT